MSGGGTNKPLLNALYYIKHVEGNKYVHPRDGGKDVPEVNTPLVFHDVREGSDLKFFFSTLNGRTYLRHYGSKRYCVPSGRGYGNGNTIIIAEGQPDTDDSLEVVEIEGLAFLRGSGTTQYIHPRGGSNHPGNSTELVTNDGWRPALALSFIPAEDYEIINTEFDVSSMNNTPGQIVTSTYSTQSNFGTQPLPYTFRTNYQQSVTNTVEFTLSTELGVSISTTATAGIKLVEASVTVEYSFKIGTSSTKATSTTQGLENEHTLSYNIPVGKTVKVFSQTERKNGQRIPFKSTVRSKRGQEFVLTGYANIDVFFNQRGYLYEYPNGEVPTSPPRPVDM